MFYMLCAYCDQRSPLSCSLQAPATQDVVDTLVDDMMVDDMLVDDFVVTESVPAVEEAIAESVAAQQVRTAQAGIYPLLLYHYFINIIALMLHDSFLKYAKEHCLIF